MGKLMLAATLGVCLGACTFPQNTKMEPVGEQQMQTSQPPAPAGGTTEDEQHKKTSAR
jgi:hypothetical protein